jgi:glycosyltransferase involved in cell wall biosynthesis
LATNPLRLTAVTHNLLLGGATTFLLNFLRALPGEEAALSLVCASERNEHAADFAGLGVTVPAAPSPRLIYEDRLSNMYGQLAATRPHAVLACLGAESFEMLRLAPAGVARIGLIQSHDPLPYEMARRYHASLDAMVGVSPQICAHLRSLPEFAAVRVEEIPYGIHFADEAARPAAAAPLRVLYLGRLIEIQKRISRMVELVRRCEAAGMAVRFTFAGAGPDEAQVRRELAGSPLVTFAGPVSNAQVTGLLREHDLLILLSDFEGLPLSLLEAMGEGLVPIVSDLPGGMGLVVTPEVGFRVPVGDVAAAAELLAELARAPGRLEALSAAARTRAREDYSSGLMVARYLALVRSIVPADFEPAWPDDAAIPAPFGVPAWQYEGLARMVRRGLRRVFPKK